MGRLGWSMCPPETKPLPRPQEQLEVTGGKSLVYAGPHGGCGGVQVLFLSEGEGSG